MRYREIVAICQLLNSRKLCK